MKEIENEVDRFRIEQNGCFLTILTGKHSLKQHLSKLRISHCRRRCSLGLLRFHVRCDRLRDYSCFSYSEPSLGVPCLSRPKFSIFEIIIKTYESETSGTLGATEENVSLKSQMSFVTRGPTLDLAPLATGPTLHTFLHLPQFGISNTGLRMQTCCTIFFVYTLTPIMGQIQLHF